jgi:hypothetical protein
MKNENRPETAERKQVVKLEEVNQKTKEAMEFPRRSVGVRSQ